jgi:hypothetical protein
MLVATSRRLAATPDDSAHDAIAPDETAPDDTPWGRRAGAV